GPLLVPDDQAGPVPVGQPLQRLAAGPHPLLPDGPDVRPAPRHADVLSGRPPLPVRPDLQLRARPEAARADDQPLQHRLQPGQLGARLRVRHRGRPDPVRMSPTPSQTVGPYLAIGLPWADGPVADPDGVRISGLVLDGAG